MSQGYNIESVEQLEQLFGEPSELVKQKVCAELDDAMKEFIRRSPLLFISTIDSAGNIDCSPKGDASGFVRIGADDRLQIPERPGNKLTYGFRNILANNRVGLIFVVPNMRETLRVKGTASLTNDPALLELLSAQSKPALLCTQVAVEECFFHCGKAMIRSNMWKPEKWKKHEDSLLVRQLTKKVDGDKSVEKAIDEHLEQSYKDNLY